MRVSFAEWLIEKTSKWLLKEDPPTRGYLCDFSRICQEIQPADVLLIEGRSRVAKIIKQVTISPWSHAVLYIGRLEDISNPHLQKIAKQHCECNPSSQLIVESEVGLGTAISLISKYKDDHVRILRPQGLTKTDGQKVIEFAIHSLGKKYSLRHLVDLARFLFPWGLFPRRWRSSLFQHNALQPTEDTCSSMIADAFQSIPYPVLPLIQEDTKKDLELIRRNPRLFTPSDFDYSPYFDVIKYPIFPLGKKGAYKNLHWRDDVVSDDTGESTTPLYETLHDGQAHEIKKFFSSPAFAVGGASTNRAKEGNKVLRCYLQHNKKVYPVNSREKMIEGVPCVAHLADLPAHVKSLSVIMRPQATIKIVEEAIALGIKHIWMEPGSENILAIEKCKKNGITVIANGPSILVELGFKE